LILFAKEIIIRCNKIDIQSSAIRKQTDENVSLCISASIYKDHALGNI